MIGQTLSHYRLVEQIGAGGMGVVYRGHDEQLERDVAVKVLPAGMLADEEARRRFRNEALVLAKINHPNIATVHEFGNRGNTDFLVTEYIPGTTLDEKLKESTLPLMDTVRLGSQLALGLSVAHEQGVVHRDLKPGNLRLTPDGRLKILDFGLAELMPSGGETDIAKTLTQSPNIVGTLPYMAPEQLRGHGADARSDIWAAGAVLYEMATGRRPFPESSTPILCDAILNRDPVTPSELNPKISPGLENVIMKALAKDPSLRYQSSRELGVDLERITAGIAPVAQAHRTKSKPLWVLTSVTLVLAALATAGYFYAHRQRGVTRTGDAGRAAIDERGVKQRPSVAVLGFKNLAGKPELAWLSTALSEMLTTELAAGEQLRTIPGENVAQMKISLAPPETDSYSKETLTRIRQHLGTDEVVLGSFVPLGDGEIRVDIKLQDAVGGETVAAVSERGSLAHLDDLVYKAGAKLRSKLGVADVSAVQSAAVRAALPSNAEAARNYAEGLSKLRVYDDFGAKELLLKAVALEPQFAQAHLALSSAWENLGYERKAQEEAKKAFTLSEALPREDRLSIEGRYRATTNDWTKAAGIYKTLFNFFPDNFEYGLQLASAQSSEGKGQDALATAEQLRAFPVPLREDPRIDLVEAEARRALSDFRNVKTAAERAAAKGQAEGSQLVVARARTFECLALRNLGDPKAAVAPCESALTIYATAGDQGGVALLQNNLGNIYYDQGNLSAAKSNYEDALKTYRRIGNQSGAAGALDNIANVMSDLGDRAGARKLSLEALKIYREVGDERGEADTLNNLAAQYVTEGNFSEAEKTFEQALKILREKGDSNGMGIALNNIGEMLLDQGRLAESKSKYEESYKEFADSDQKSKSGYPVFGLAQVLYAQGDLASARSKYEQVLAIARETDDKHNVGYALQGQGQILALQGDLAGARKLQEEGMATRKEIGEASSVAESELELARIALEERRFGEAEALARTALAEFRAEKLRENEVLARVVLARTYLAEGKTREATKEIDQASGLALKSSFLGVRLSFAIAAARVSGDAGKIPEALKSLREVSAEAERLGYREFQFEARLAIGEIELRAGRAADGRTRLQGLAKEAKNAGFLGIARKAAEVGA
jgi:eukaryotic-like serine/threonine-protein kinase